MNPNNELDTENRQSWYDKAVVWEEEFVKKYGDEFGIIINPSKNADKCSPDLFIMKGSISGDLKMLNIPFYKSQEYYGIPPQDCWTFNVSDMFDYALRYSNNFGIFIWKLFERTKVYNVEIHEEESVYYTSLFELKRIIIKNNQIHHYIRRLNDTNGNSYGSFMIDLRTLHKIK